MSQNSIASLEFEGTLEALPGRDFIDSLVLDQPPHAELGRYFLLAEQRLKDLGLTLRIVPPSELYRINVVERASWPKLNPAIDPNAAPMDDENTLVLAAYDRSGRAVATACTRYFNVATSMKDEFESLRFLYGPQRATEKRPTEWYRVHAPQVAKLYGRFFYMGGVWTLPDLRGQGLSPLIVRLARYASLARWPIDFEFGMVAPSYDKETARNGHRYEYTEDGFEFLLDGLQFKGLFVWSNRTYMLQLLRDDLRVFEANHQLTLDAVNT